ncbi:MAG TPA: (4Fe-4S)-binding protein [Gemmatimonadaceae bacterium]|nr:(4Fe-4S)-binding protein [Gemmatimonadaceae bacterium]
MSELPEKSRQPGGGEPDAAAGGAGAPPDPGEPNRAPRVTRAYATDRITVEWRAERCIHSANCIRALPRVFDPRRRPWVDVQAAEADEIARAVLRCPTGALHFVRHDGGPQEAPDVPTTLTPIRNGPLYVRGDVEVRGLDGQPIRAGTRVSLCRCGLARQIPFCDNTCRQARWREPSSAVSPSGPTGGPESAAPGVG